MSTAAILRHRGRRSGKTYVTPVGARVKGELCLVPLAYGTEADWCRNIRSAGRGQLRWKGRDYELAAPVVLTTELAGPLLSQIYPAPLRLGCKMLGTKAFLRMEARALADPS
jgi:deazaflavin-dependent oxidoreductase (nitroreductase family)